MTHNLPTTLAFENTELMIHDRNGVPWITAADLARALGYARADTVSRIFHRNEDEFTDSMSLTVKLTVRGAVAPKPTRIFSPRGCHLVAMFARTDRAKAFRKWVLDVLEKWTSGELAPAIPDNFAMIDGELVDLTQDHFQPGETVVYIDRGEFCKGEVLPNGRQRKRITTGGVASPNDLESRNPRHADIDFGEVRISDRETGRRIQRAVILGRVVPDGLSALASLPTHAGRTSGRFLLSMNAGEVTGLRNIAGKCLVDGKDPMNLWTFLREFVATENLPCALEIIAQRTAIAFGKEIPNATRAPHAI